MACGWLGLCLSQYRCLRLSLALWLPLWLLLFYWRQRLLILVRDAINGVGQMRAQRSVAGHLREA